MTPAPIHRDAAGRFRAARALPPLLRAASRSAPHRRGHVTRRANELARLRVMHGAWLVAFAIRSGVMA